MINNLEALLDAASLAYYNEDIDNKGAIPLRVSSAGSCPRATLIKMLGEAQERDLDPLGSRIFSLGSQRGEAHARGLALHAASLDHDERFMVLPEKQVWITVPAPAGRGPWTKHELDTLTNYLNEKGDPDAPLRIGPNGEVLVRGHADCVLVDRNGDATLIEFKTARSYALKGIDPDRIETVNESYLVQVALYAHGLTSNERLLTGAGMRLKSAAIVFEEKDSQELTIVRFNDVSVLQPWAELGLRNLSDIVSAFVDGRELPRPYQPNEKGFLPWQCNYCTVAQHCWKDRSWRDAQPTGRIPKGCVDVTPNETVSS